MKLVIKFAGALLESDAVVRELAAQVAALAKQGHEILIVHGGGRIFTGTLKRLGIESKFVNGLRVTDRETRDVAVMVFAGLLNKQLSAAISAAGQPAIGISAADAQVFRAEPLVHNEVAGGLGFVGYLTGMNTSLIESLWHTNLVPVAASRQISLLLDDGARYSRRSGAHPLAPRHGRQTCRQVRGAQLRHARSMTNR